MKKIPNDPFRRILAVGVSTLFTLVLAACVPGAGSGSGSQGGGSKTGTLTFWLGGDPIGKAGDILSSYISDFESSHEGVKVNVVRTGTAHKQKVQAALVSRDLPDIVQWWGGSFMQPLIAANALLPLDAYIGRSNDWKSGLVDNWSQNYTFSGKVYAAPTDAPTVQLYYNKSLLASSGISQPPGTFDELLAAVAALKAKGITPIAIDGKDGWPLQEVYTYLAMRNGGANLIHDALSKKTPWTDSAFVLAATQLRQLVDAGAFADGWLADDSAAADARFMTSKAAMYIFGSWTDNAVVSADDKSLIDKVASVPFPLTPGGKGALTELQGGPNGSLSISTKSKMADIAWEFIKGYTSVEHATAVAIGTLVLVPNKITYNRSAVPELYNAHIDELAKATGFNLFWNELLTPEDNTKFTDLTNSLVQGTISPQQMMDQFAAYMNK